MVFLFSWNMRSATTQVLFFLNTFFVGCNFGPANTKIVLFTTWYLNALLYFKAGKYIYTTWNFAIILLPATPIPIFLSICQSGRWSWTWSRPRCHLRSHSPVCIKNHLFIVGIGPILNKELEFIFLIWSVWSYVRL